MFKVAQYTDSGKKYLLDKESKVALFFTKESAKQMAFQISEGIPEIEEHMAVEQVTTFEDTIKADYFDQGVKGEWEHSPYFNMVRLYMIEANGATPMYTWMSDLEITKELTDITGVKFRAKNVKVWQSAMAKHLPNWTILETDDVDEAYL